MYTIRSHNRTETADTLPEAKAIAKRRAQEYADHLDGARIVWCGPSSWGTDEETRSHGGYAVANAHDNDVAEGAATIDSPAE